MKNWRVKYRVVRSDDSGTRDLAGGNVLKRAETADELRTELEKLLKNAFPQGDVYDVDYVIDIREEKEDERVSA